LTGLEYTTAPLLHSGHDLIIIAEGK